MRKIPYCKQVHFVNLNISLAADYSEMDKLIELLRKYKRLKKEVKNEISRHSPRHRS